MKDSVLGKLLLFGAGTFYFFGCNVSKNLNSNTVRIPHPLDSLICPFPNIHFNPVTWEIDSMLRVDSTSYKKENCHQCIMRDSICLKEGKWMYTRWYRSINETNHYSGYYSAGLKDGIWYGFAEEKKYVFQKDFYTQDKLDSSIIFDDNDGSRLIKFQYRKGELNGTSYFYTYSGELAGVVEYASDTVKEIVKYVPNDVFAKEEFKLYPERLLYIDVTGKRYLNELLYDEHEELK
jgi:hypothetical protein